MSEGGVMNWLVFVGRVLDVWRWRVFFVGGMVILIGVKRYMNCHYVNQTHY